jgi:hypothetical protein
MSKGRGAGGGGAGAGDAGPNGVTRAVCAYIEALGRPYDDALDMAREYATLGADALDGGVGALATEISTVVADHYVGRAECLSELGRAMLAAGLESVDWRAVATRWMAAARAREASTRKRKLAVIRGERK